MDIGACFTMQQDNEFAKFTEAADKTLAQRLSICRPRPPVASDLPARDRTKVQKICIGEINLGIFLKSELEISTS